MSCFPISLSDNGSTVSLCFECANGSSRGSARDTSSFRRQSVPKEKTRKQENVPTRGQQEFEHAQAGALANENMSQTQNATTVKIMILMRVGC